MPGEAVSFTVKSAGYFGLANQTTRRNVLRDHMENHFMLHCFAEFAMPSSPLNTLRNIFLAKVILTQIRVITQLTHLPKGGTLRIVGFSAFTRCRGYQTPTDPHYSQC